MQERNSEKEFEVIRMKRGTIKRVMTGRKFAYLTLTPPPSSLSVPVDCLMKSAFTVRGRWQRQCRYAAVEY